MISVNYYIFHDKYVNFNDATASQRKPEPAIGSKKQQQQRQSRQWRQQQRQFIKVNT